MAGASPSQAPTERTHKGSQCDRQTVYLTTEERGGERDAREEERETEGDRGGERWRGRQRRREGRGREGIFS